MKNPVPIRSLATALLACALLPAASAQIIGTAVAGQNWPSLQTPPGNPFVNAAGQPFVPLPGSATERQALLGKALFWDEQVSSDRTMSCGTCHIPAVGGVDPRGAYPSTTGGKRGSLGMVPQDAGNQYTDFPGLTMGRQVTPIAVPTNIAAAFFAQVLWNQSAGPNFTDAFGNPFLLGGIDQFPAFSGLESQAVGPPVNSVEMSHAGLTWPSGLIQARLGPARPLALATPGTIPAPVAGFIGLAPDYNSLADIAFAGHPLFGGAIGLTRERFALSVATYERTLIPDQAPIDTRTLTASEANGMAIMQGSGCFGCHSVTGNPTQVAGGGLTNPFDNLFSDGINHSINVPPPVGTGTTNVKTPTLRNVALRTHFLHNGSLKTLPDLLAFDNTQIGAPAFPFAGAPLPATQLRDVRAFLRALTDPRLEVGKPPFDHPDLYADRVPFATNEHGTGTSPALPNPDIVVNSPLINTGELKIGVVNAPAGANAVLFTSPLTAGGPTTWIDFATATPQPAVTVNAAGAGTLLLPTTPAAIVGSAFHAQWRIAAFAPTMSNAGTLVVQ